MSRMQARHVGHMRRKLSIPSLAGAAWAALILLTVCVCWISPEAAKGSEIEFSKGAPARSGGACSKGASPVAGTNSSKPGSQH